MSLPKSPWLIAAVALIWALGNLATVRWGIQARPWFPYAVFGAIGITFAILYLDGWLIKRGLAAKSRWTQFYQGLGVTFLFGIPELVRHEPGMGFILIICIVATVAAGISGLRARN